MPILKGAASQFTTLTRVNATQNNDPEKKSRTFVAPNKAVIAPVVRESLETYPRSNSFTFVFTGGPQRFDVPGQVVSLQITLVGAGGASHGGGSYVNGGAGGYVSGVLRVTPGEILEIVVGGGGVGAIGGYGGGGTGFDVAGANVPGGGGGRTAIRRFGEDIVTAGGGGGAGRGVSGSSGIGGAGGGLIGQDSQIVPNSGHSTATLGKGGTQTAGGAGGATGGGAGSKYTGGNGATGSNDDTGGGGGGWYGGGGGGNDSTGTYGGGGGGGSSYVAMLDPYYPILNTQGAGAAGGTGGNGDPQRPGGNGFCIIQTTRIPGFHFWKSPGFIGRVYV